MAGAGYDVTLIVQHEKDEVVDGVRIVAIPKPRNRLWRMMVTSWTVFYLALRQKADIYNLHDPELLPWGWLLQKLTGKPVVYDMHENYGEVILFRTWLPHFLRKPIAWISDRLEKLLVRRLSAIITVTEPMKQRLSRAQAFCVSVGNFPSLDLVDTVGESREFDGKEWQYSVIYTGGASKQRGFQTIIDALALVVRQSPNVSCAVLGDTKNLGWLDEDHNRLMNRLIKDGNIKIIGRVPHTEVFRYLNASTIGWRPRLPYQDAMDVTFLEYMSCGKPIVASDVPLISDIIRETKCGMLVDPYDAGAHASAILYLLEHPDEATKMGENGRRAVLEKYNWEAESKKLLDLYEGLLREA